MVQRSDRWRPYRMVVLSRRRFGARDQDPRWFLRFARPLDRWRQPCTAWLLPVGLRARCWRPGYRSGSHLVHRDYLPLGGGRVGGGRGTAPAAVVLVPPADRAQRPDEGGVLVYLRVNEIGILPAALDLGGA